MTTPAVQAALSPLRDLPQVQGCFVVSDMGRLLARDLSALFGDDVLACVLRFSDHLVLLRPMRDGVVGVLASSDVNVLALKMGLNLTVRRLNAALDPAVPPGGASQAF